MSFHDFSGNSQADSGTGVLLGGMKTFKNAKDAVPVMGFDAYPIVLHRKNPLPRLALDGNVRLGCCVLLEFNGIGDQVLKDLGE